MSAPTTILIIEDDFLIRTCLTEFLEDSDMQVLEAESCAEARQHLQNDRHVDVLIADLSLPDGDGAALISEIRAARPALPVIYTTGHGARIGERVQLNPEIDRVISKPYALDAVCQTVTELGKLTRHSA
ncbi:response regulator [Kozakia baliensis]|uniref:Uncharacterized protein n=1 Tax=Kozakia baliensis TaxID=153496 RepID=A0A1D8US96_9PROT|nr:response regulator [Kozakia baliensis]AOX16508.1 hypothetical protein A0U89_04530 [Kozakia baliensis]GBR29294.1 two-component transcriptional regulator [Kozakia baliensis NRIC 0488]GEL63391.1 response regulator [Kozakia baliensis]